MCLRAGYDPARGVRADPSLGKKTLLFLIVSFFYSGRGEASAELHSHSFHVCVLKTLLFLLHKFHDGL